MLSLKYRTIEISQTQPHLPYEFSHEGMLQRLSAYIQHQVCLNYHFHLLPAIWQGFGRVNHT